MTVQELIDALNKQPSDATVIISSGDYPDTPTHVSQIPKERFDGYYTPGFAAKRRDLVVVVS